MTRPHKLAHVLLLTLSFGVSQVVCACPSFAAGDVDTPPAHEAGQTGHDHADRHHPAPSSADPADAGHDGCGHCDLPELGSDATAARDVAPAPAQPSLLAARPAVPRDATPPPARTTTEPPDPAGIPATPVTRRDLLLD